MSKVDKALIEEGFKILDADGDGKIDKDQVVFGIRALGKVVGAEQAKAIEDQVKGQCDLRQFQELYATKGLRNFEEYEQDMRNAFKALDSENNGKIMEHELRHILRNLGAGRIPATEVDLLMTEVHPDPSGGVNYDDFVDQLVSGYPPEAGL